MRRPTLWFIFFAALALLFHRVLLGDALFWGLPSLQFIPWRTEAVEMLRSGSLPLWNTLNGAGAPLFANYQSSLLYPFSWLTLIFPVAPTMSLTAVAHLAIAAVGMARLGAAIGMAPFGRIVSAIAFALGGYLVGRLGTFPIIQAAAWLPWLLWAIWRLMDEITPRRAAACAAIVALLLLAGHAQTAWYTLLLAGCFTVFTWIMRTGRRSLALLVIGGTVLLGGGVAAVQLVATAELLRESARSDGVDRDFALNFSYAPARTLNVIAPHVFGTPANGSYITGGAYFEDAIYIGLIPLVSAIGALIAAGRGRASRGWVSFWGGVVVVGFIMALGYHSPIFLFLFDQVPTFDLFQAPVRWHLWTVTGLSILAGFGVGAWGRDVRTRRWTRRALVAAGTAVALSLGALALLTITASAVALLAWAVVWVGTTAIAACLLTLTQPPPESRRRPLWEGAVVVVIAVDLVIASWGLNPTVPASFYDPLPIDAAGRSYFDQTAENARFDDLLRFNDYRVALSRIGEYRTAFLPNLNVLDRIALLNNFDPLQSGRHLDYLRLLQTSDSDSALLIGAGVSGEITATGLALLTAQPRAWLVESACWHEDDAALRAALLDPTWNPAVQVHLAGDAGCPAPTAASGSAAMIIHDSENALDIEVRAERDSWLVLADSWYPGWTATVNAEPASIYTANRAFRAVQVPSGVSIVEMRYAPSWAIPGAFISTIALIGLLLLARLTRRVSAGETG
ncbi:MAG: YfhO family protein [Chloroflexota bacterium]|nr:YfhO family protein [Chloroflexota bacterium]